MKPGATLKEVFFFANGQVAAIDRTGAQVPEWQWNAVARTLLAMQEAGVLAADTRISCWIGEDPEVEWAEFSERYRLFLSPTPEAPSPAAED